MKKPTKPSRIKNKVASVNGKNSNEIELLPILWADSSGNEADSQNGHPAKKKGHNDQWSAWIDKMREEIRDFQSLTTDGPNASPSQDEKGVYSRITKLSDDRWVGMKVVPETIAARGQIGLSYVMTYQNKKLFLKQPAPPTKTDVSHYGGTEEYYDEMGKRLQSEFAKNAILSYIHTRCLKDTFTIPRPIAFCKVRGQNIPGILYEHIHGDDMVQKEYSASKTKEFFHFAIGLAECVRIIHNHGILHSFIVPRNIIKHDSRDTFSLVGFGYSSLCDSKATRPKVEEEEDNAFRAPECLDSDNLGALWLPSDIYSLGAIFYKIITGHPPKNLPKDVVRLKAHIYQNVMAAKDGLFFKDNENVVKILDKCLRYNPDDRFSCAEELIEALRIAATAGKRKRIKTPKADRNKAKAESDAVTKENVAGLFLHIAKKANISVEENELFKSLIWTKATNLYEDAQRIGRGHYEVYGDRDVLIASLCRLLSGATRKQVYRTMTYPGYWTDNNLGSNGRFLTMNKHMARQGLRIQRLFLVTTEFHQLIETEQEILESQLAAQLSVEKTPIENYRPLEIKVKVLTPREEDELLRFEADSSQVAYLGPDTKEKEISDNAIANSICLNFISQGKMSWTNGRKSIERTIRKIRYWTPTINFQKETFRQSISLFNKYWGSGSLTLESYIHAPKNSPLLSEILGR